MLSRWIEVSGAKVDDVLRVQSQRVGRMSAAALGLRHRDGLDALDLIVGKLREVQRPIEGEDIAVRVLAREIDTVGAATADMAEVDGVLNYQEVVAIAAEQEVNARAGNERIVPGAADQDVVAVIADQLVIAIAALDVIVVGAAGQDVVAVAAADDDVGLRAALVDG